MKNLELTPEHRRALYLLTTTSAQYEEVITIAQLLLVLKGLLEEGEAETYWELNKNTLEAIEAELPTGRLIIPAERVVWMRETVNRLEGKK